MSAARKMGMLLATIVALAAFFWQTTACYAEHASLIPCHEQTGDSAATDDVGERHCCHTESNAFAGQVVPATFLVLKETGYHSRPFGAPDAPIQEIEYPPQVLS